MNSWQTTAQYEISHASGFDTAARVLSIDNFWTAPGKSTLGHLCDEAWITSSCSLSRWGVTESPGEMRKAPAYRGRGQSPQALARVNPIFSRDATTGLSSLEVAIHE